MPGVVMGKAAGIVVGMMREVSAAGLDPMELLTRAWGQYVAETG